MLAGAVVATLASCTDGDFPIGISLHNDTQQAVRITYVIDGVEAPPSDSADAGHDSIPAGASQRFVSGLGKGSPRCTSVEIVARADGREVARILPPVCDEGGGAAGSPSIDLSAHAVPVLERMLPGTLNGSATKRLAYTSATALASQPCYGCQQFHASEVHSMAIALGVDIDDVTIGGVSWGSADGIEAIAVEALRAPGARVDPAGVWLALRVAAQTKISSASTTISQRAVQILVDETRTDWSGTSYVCARGDTLFVVHYTNTANKVSRQVPDLVATLIGSLP